MKKVVIESPYRGHSTVERERNRRYAISCMIDSMKRGEAPYASHLLYTQFLNEENKNERNLGIEMGLTWGEEAELVAVYKDLGVSKGMTLGIRRAKKNGKTIEYRKLAVSELLINLDYISLSTIALEVSKMFNISYSKLKARIRDRNIVDVRHVFMAVAWTLLPKFSLITIGKELERDHATVISSLKTVRDVKQVREMYEKFCAIKNINPRYYEPSQKNTLPLDSKKTKHRNHKSSTRSGVSHEPMEKRESTILG